MEDEILHDHENLSQAPGLATTFVPVAPPASRREAAFMIPKGSLRVLI
jgi:hypothetical protein